MQAKTLEQSLMLQIGNRGIEGTKLPASIVDNLNPVFALRPYQQRVFKLLKNYWEEAFDGKPKQHHQLLFHMATGSGKTMIMAGTIAYLYEKGYRNFLFFVNSTNIIDKTRNNFCNKASKKYLFAESLAFHDRRVEIREVDNFSSVASDSINILFTTIQGLHSSLNNPKENSITYEDFENHEIVLISDEAHHINADTKKGEDTTELLEIVSWEKTVERIFRGNAKNVLLEFTATVDFTDEKLAAKYQPKLIFDYPLREFRKDGYSKEVRVLQADLAPFDRAIQAVVLSQYRRKIFEKHHKVIKPVLLFKSKTIKESQDFLVEFTTSLKELKPETLKEIHSRTDEPTIKRIFDYLAANSISLENFIKELQEDFAEEKLISVNSLDESVAKQIAVNSLETNEFRAVFAVDKLNEGWDVLNLFDIIRLYDTRDSKAGKIGKTTMSEAQLIGRGARYCPFQISSDQPLYGRKYDSDLNNELRVCEELYYHSGYNPKYIQELNNALREIGMKPSNARERTLKLKANFKSTPLFKAGHIFLNSRRKYNREDVDGLDHSLITRSHEVRLRTGYGRSTIAFEQPLDQDGKGIDRVAKDYAVSDFGKTIIRKAILRLEFYRFDNLKRYLPKLTSIDEFITSKKYLGKIKVSVSGLKEQVEMLTREQMLDVTIQVLEVISGVISSDKIEFKGTKEFEPHMIKEIFHDSAISFVLDEDSDAELGRSMKNSIETNHYLDLSTRDWYAFEDCFGTSEEKLLVLYIDKRYPDLAKKYASVHLLRNEQHFKLYAFADGGALQPDFVLFLIGKEDKNTMHYQVFIEPKGGHLLKADKWKEEFLTAIKAEHKVEQLFSNKHYVIWGLPFFNKSERMNEFETEFNKLT